MESSLPLNYSAEADVLCIVKCPTYLGQEARGVDISTDSSRIAVSSSNALFTIALVDSDLRVLTQYRFACGWYNPTPPIVHNAAHARG